MFRWLARRTDALRRRLGALGFGPRLFLALVVALAVVGAAGYKLISDRLYQQQLDSYARTQQADADGFEAIARKYPRPRVAIRRIDELLDALGRRPGAIEAILIGPDNVVSASNIEALNGKRDSDPRINGALHSGISYAGHEADPSRPSANFEFVTPVSLPGGRYALEMSFNDGSFEAQLADVRSVLLLVMALAVIGVAGLFYLLGGRTLLRHHRLALQRATRDGLTDLPNHRAFQDELAAGGGRGGAQPGPAGARPARPRRLQADQRSPRPPPGRRAAEAGRRGPARRARRRPRLPDRRRRVRPADADTDEQGARILVRV